MLEDRTAVAHARMRANASGAAKVPVRCGVDHTRFRSLLPRQNRQSQRKPVAMQLQRSRPPAASVVKRISPGSIDAPDQQLIN
ncbi:MULTISPECIES: hypothetical protein [unclassified Bradyrhizobium]|uniref:hypothetical protein n=1 Tax=unclassified Bradyrhizobium TaxID=2631580 RepID=UPI0024E0E0C4|nr:MULTISPECIES: hypothetical protein [unclassified Bradyrhizobium]